MDARRAAGGRLALRPPVLGPVPRNAVLGSFHSHRGRSSLPDLETGLLALFTDFVTGEIAKYGYLAIFVLMLLESAVIPIPSEVTMLFGGALIEPRLRAGAASTACSGSGSRAWRATSSARGSPTGSAGRAAGR